MASLGRPIVALLTLLGVGLIAVACDRGGDADGASGSATPLVASTQPAAGAISDDEVPRLLDRLLPGSVGPESVQSAVDRIVAADDARFVAVFIELLRASQIGVAPTAYLPALRALSGQPFGGYWPSWVEWYGGTDLEPPPGFTGWKGRLLARIDPGFGDFLLGEHRSRIRVEEIVWGGVSVDGIPALDNPRMIAAGEAEYLGDDEPVFGLEINGDARAYPLRIMDWHEMANDVVGGVAVSLAYCTLCGAGIAYAGRAPDGNEYTFGSSGLLFRSNKLMYDRQTRTLWNQFTGEPVLGELVGADGEEPLRLTLLPLVLTGWGQWRAKHPDTLVLDPDTGFVRIYEPGAPYADYFSSRITMFPLWQRSDLLETKARIYALRIDGVPKAYPLDLLTTEAVVNDTLAGTPVVLVATSGVVEVDSSNPAVGVTRYEAGGEVRAYDRGAEKFAPGPDADTVLDSLGRPWRVTEQALEGPGGELAPRVAGHLAYWFGWFTFFPRTLVYGQP